MRTIRFLLQKEFRQIFRNKTILALITIMPIMQLIILPLTADYEVKNINLAVTDHDRSPYSAKLLARITSSGYFRLSSFNKSYHNSLNFIESGEANLVLEIPPHFEKELVNNRPQKVSIAVNAINGVKANLGGSYLVNILKEFQTDVLAQRVPSGNYSLFPNIEVVTSFWYNPRMNYKLFMVPGILAILVTMIGGFLSALNIVKEKETGTIEQINVTPIRKHHFIIGKLVPFWILGNVIFTIGLFVSWLFYGIVPQGNIFLLYGFVAVYLLAVLGFGLLISTFCETQQQAMFIMFFFMMIFILMGGLFTSIEAMPGWAAVIARLTPACYLIEVMRMVTLKGSGGGEILFHLLIVAAFALVLNTWAVINYRKTS